RLLPRQCRPDLPYLFMFCAWPRHDERRLPLSRFDPARPPRRGPAISDGLGAAARPVSSHHRDRAHPGIAVLGQRKKKRIEGGTKIFGFHVALSGLRWMRSVGIQGLVRNSRIRPPIWIAGPIDNKITFPLAREKPQCRIGNGPVCVECRIVAWIVGGYPHQD